MTHRITLTADRIPAVTDEGDGGYPATLQGPVQAELVRRFDNGIIGAYIVDEDGEGYTASIGPGKYVNEALPYAPAELPTDRVTVHGP